MKNIYLKNIVRHQISNEEIYTLPSAVCQSNKQGDTEHLKIKKALGEHFLSEEFG